MNQREVQILLRKMVQAVHDGTSCRVKADLVTYTLKLPFSLWDGQAFSMMFSLGDSGVFRMEWHPDIPSTEETVHFVKMTADFCRLDYALSQDRKRIILSRESSAFGKPEWDLLDFAQDCLRFDAILSFPDWRNHLV